ncbi:Uncharacterized protein FWK35_00013402, partial [Aphis craccivora]
SNFYEICRKRENLQRNDNDFKFFISHRYLKILPFPITYDHDLSSNDFKYFISRSSYNSERCDECIDFTMMGGFRWKSEYPWYIIEVKGVFTNSFQKNREKQKQKKAGKWIPLCCTLVEFESNDNYHCIRKTILNDDDLSGYNFQCLMKKVENLVLNFELLATYTKDFSNIDKNLVENLIQATSVFRPLQHKPFSPTTDNYILGWQIIFIHEKYFNSIVIIYKNLDLLSVNTKSSFENISSHGTDVATTHKLLHTNKCV